VSGRTVRRNSKLLGKLFQNSRVFVQGFPKKSLAVCAISRGYKGSKPKEPTSKSFRHAGLLLDALPALTGPLSAKSHREGSSAFGRRPRAFSSRMAEGGFIGSIDSG
jgi:hypothetical protein